MRGSASILPASKEPPRWRRYEGGSMPESERKLWRAVLEQAYEDAETGPNGNEDGWESADCLKARRYLRADSPFEAAELKLVCEFADLPDDRIISWARRQYAAAA
jgi:hypothetical protein